MILAARIAAAAAGAGVVAVGTWMYTDKAPEHLPPGYARLSDYQAQCAVSLAILQQSIPLLSPEGAYRSRLGEAERTAMQAAWYAATGKGIENSLHRDRLALDIMMDQKINGEWVWLNGAGDTKQGYIKACKAWKFIGANSSPPFPATCGAEWGDYVHFSCAYKGRK